MSELDILKNIIENKDKIFENINEAKEKLIPTVNIINILGNTYYEVSNSSLLHNLLKIKFKYENKEINFAKDFSLYIINNVHTENTEIDDAIIKYMLREHNIHIGEKTAEEIKINIGDAFKGDISKTMDIRGRDSINGLPKTETVNIAEVRDAIKYKIKDAKFENVYREFQTKDGRRIDILIVFDTFEIIIENKINAGDQENQLGDYYIDRNNGKLVFLVYLTTYGYKPSEFSIDKKLLEELENKICYLSHDDIAEWIENDILNKYQFLKEKEFESIYSALIQIKDNEKFISKRTEENKMEINEIKKHVDFDLLLKDVNDLDKKVSELNKSIELFENAKKVIADMKSEIILENESVKNDIKYSLDVGNYLKEKGIIAQILNEEAIRREIGDKGVSHNIGIYITPIWHHLYILLFQLVSGLLITIEGSISGNLINKVKEKDIKNKINEILNGYDYEGSGGDDESIYWKYINIEKDKPQDTAQKMIDLYNFLKEKIAQ